MTHLVTTSTDKNPLRTNPRHEFSKLDDNVLLSVREVAAVCGLSIHTIKSWRRDGRGPQAVKMGRSVRYGVGDLRAWLTERRKAA